jgi:hypothetical protein
VVELCRSFFLLKDLDQWFKVLSSISLFPPQDHPSTTEERKKERKKINNNGSGIIVILTGG